MDSTTDLGTVINTKAAKLFDKRVLMAEEEGAKILYHPGRQGALLPPIVLDHVNPKSELVLDLNYEEDSNAECDVNIVMNDDLEFIEIQGTGEEKSFSKEEFNGLLDLAEGGIKDLFKLQTEIIKNG